MTVRRKFTREFKIGAVEQMKGGVSVVRLARQLEVNPNQLHLWKRQFEERPNSAFSGEGRRLGEENRIAELERKVGQQAMELDFLKKCLRRIEEMRSAQAQTSNPPSAARSGRKKKGGRA
jgi:transposase-like protein